MGLICLTGGNKSISLRLRVSLVTWSQGKRNSNALTRAERGPKLVRDLETCRETMEL